MLEMLPKFPSRNFQLATKIAEFLAEHHFHFNEWDDLLDEVRWIINTAGLEHIRKCTPENFDNQEK
ncbi:MAG: hypothetical protein FWD01_04935 [Defluviitaleaceae bacterium]|nr:hypothetical protein [Defluviitaleaceae bacterium]